MAITRARHGSRPSTRLQPGYASARHSESHGFRHDDFYASSPRPTRVMAAAIQFPVGLEAGSLDRSALAAVEHASMDSGTVGSPGHQAVEDIQLPDQMAFAHSADRRIARHLTDIFSPESDQAHARPAARRGSCCLASGMTCTYDEDVEHGQALSGLGRFGKSSQTTVSRETFICRGKIGRTRRPAHLPPPPDR